MKKRGKKILPALFVWRYMQRINILAAGFTYQKFLPFLYDLKQLEISSDYRALLSGVFLSTCRMAGFAALSSFGTVAEDVYQ
ncbi:hypothetical protein SAMN04488053_103194 [Alkalicoccus daliensis]|uniref:Uncharacterized protein n=1 Tax=Alkalicoccus daliensis TaxID=745820 RepID=A0A1H0E3R7_9BACI|nr:hypothetical protein SAMN04488053_103194 [Alkalicoccus daliensis]